MARMRVSENQARKAFQECGLKFGLSPEKINFRFAKLIGQVRSAQWDETAAAVHAGARPQSVLYEQLESADEANLLMSIQADLLVKNALWLVESVASHIGAGSTLVDLGCGTGVLTAWIASLFPEARIIGVDRISRLMEFATAATAKYSNLSFVRWDYADEAPPNIQADALVSSVGIDFVFSQGRSTLDVWNRRKSDVCARTHEFASPYLRNWRAIAREGARLFAVLRLPHLENMIGFADAAHGAGWRLLTGECTRVDAGHEGSLPAVTLIAEGQLAPASEDAILSWWVFTSKESSLPSRLKEAEALMFYRTLRAVEVVRKASKTYADGHTMRVELGRVGPLAFLFARATTGFAELNLSSLDRMSMLEVSFPWDWNDTELDELDPKTE